MHTCIGSGLDILENQELFLVETLVSAHILTAAVSRVNNSAGIDARALGDDQRRDQA